MDRIVALRAFGRVVETGSFTRAADSLSMGKATVTRLIKQLEDHVGAQLVTRTTRRVAVTREGASYYDRTVTLLRELEEVDLALGAQQTAPKGRLKIEVGAAVAHRIIVPALGSFHRRYPDIHLELGASDQRSDVVVDNVDCAIRAGLITDESLIARRIGHFDFITCASPEYLARHGQPQHPRDLHRGHQIIGFTSARTGRVTPFEFSAAGESLEVEAHSKLCVNELNCYVEAGVDGLGIIQTARFSQQGHIDAGRLVPILTDWHSAGLPAHVIYAPNRYVSARLRVFIDWVVELFAHHPLLAPTPAGDA